MLTTLSRLLALCLTSLLPVVAAVPFGIHVVDEATGRGVPLIELRTVNDIRLVTDSAGWVAFNEPGLMGREVYFGVSGPGYELGKDGFGFAGIRPTPREGETFTLKLKRTNIAERLARVTGQGIYRDSELLGLPCPVPNLMAEVMGQDSVQATVYQGRVFWLWGDTNNPQYPLGNYQTTCATTPLAMRPESGLRYDYFMDAQKPTRLRHACPHPEPGCVWLFGLLTVKDEATGKDALIAHYGRFEGLDKPKDQGLARFNDERGSFDRVLELRPEQSWQHPRGVATRATTSDGEHFYFAHPFAHTRVRATLAEVMNPASYEALAFDEKAQRYRWQREQPPTTQAEERKLLLAGKMQAAAARYPLQDATSAKPVQLHGGSIAWNAYRQRYVLIGLEFGDKDAPSPLGEIWYAEATAPDGPWHKAVKVVSHPRYSFYNPVHHPFFDAEDGRVIYFQGTYTLEFSGNPLAPARYDYNQLMYRLDLDDPRLGKSKFEARNSKAE